MLEQAILNAALCRQLYFIPVAAVTWDRNLISLRQRRGEEVTGSRLGISSPLGVSGVILRTGV